MEKGKIQKFIDWVWLNYVADKNESAVIKQLRDAYAKWKPMRTKAEIRKKYKGRLPRYFRKAQLV